MTNENKGLTQEEINSKNKIGPEFENQKAILYRAAELKKQMKQDKEEYGMLYAQVMEMVKEKCLDKKKPKLDVGDLGRFVVVPSTSWSYSTKVMAEIVILEDMKNAEKADGTATAEITEILKFNGKKQTDA